MCPSTNRIFAPSGWPPRETWFVRSYNRHWVNSPHATSTKEAVAATLRSAASLAKGSTFVMSFMLPIDLAEPELRPGIEAAARGARANGTPWLSFFTPEELLALAAECGLTGLSHVSADALSRRYFSGRTDGLRLPSNSEELLVAR